jgi:hypothetical protein
VSSECWQLEGEPASLARALEEEVMGLYTLWEKSFHSTSSQVSRQLFNLPGLLTIFDTKKEKNIPKRVRIYKP